MRQQAWEIIADGMALALSEAQAAHPEELLVTSVFLRSSAALLILLLAGCATQPLSLIHI